MADVGDFVAPAIGPSERVRTDVGSLKGEILVGAVDFYAKGARRDRFVRSGFNLGLSAS